MMQVQNQMQQFAEEEFLLPLSEDELASVQGGGNGWDGFHDPPILPDGDRKPQTPLGQIFSFIHNTEGEWWSFL
jgi:bacteriocin-like protein